MRFYLARLYFNLVALWTVSVLVFPLKGNAFCFAPQLKASDEYFVSSLVVSAIVLSARNELDPEDPDGWTGTFYTLHVEHRFRGPALHRLTVYSENTTARFPMVLQRRYVLFLSRDPAGHWVVDNCGNSGLQPRSSAMLRELGRLPLKQSFVYGEVYPFSGPMTCPPMQLTLHKGPDSVSTLVKRNCSFRVNVAPGDYSATVSYKGNSVLPYDLSYKDPYCFTVPKGGSAGLAFRPESDADELNRHALQEQDKRLRQACS